MFTDMVGYTALGQRNESLSLALVEEQRKVVRPILARHNGREVKTIGDAFLVDFGSALDAVRCAYEIQRATKEFNILLAEDRRVHLRIGIHLGDVVDSQGDISGDAVNVASRIEPIAEDGGVCVTRQVYDQVRNKVDLSLTSLGSRSLKNVIEPVEVYRMEMPWQTQISKTETLLPLSRIAILPFTSMSPDPNDAFLADGVTEEIISTASGISGLSVISRTSVMGYKGTTKKIGEIGKELNAGSVLEGSFRKAGNRIRVTAQLVDVNSDSHLWSQNYDRNLDDVFEVQSEIAEKVADSLRIKILTPEKERIERKPTENTTAYTLYLKGRYHLSKRGLDDIKKASEYFELAVHEDPSFALGYAGLGDCALLLRNMYSIEPQANLERARARATKALELDPELGEAHATMGFLYSSEFNYRKAEEEYEKAIQLKPSYAIAHMWYYHVLSAQLRWNEGLQHLEKALELDPLFPVTYTNLGDYYFRMREFAKSIEPLRRAVDLGSPDAHLYLSSAYGMMKRFDDMEREAAAFANHYRATYPFVGIAIRVSNAYFRGDKENLIKLLPDLVTHFQEANESAYQIAVYYFYLGEGDKGFEWLEKAYADKEYNLHNVKSDWDLDVARTDPRYLGFLKKIGLD